jgi:hypothetical protein
VIAALLLASALADTPCGGELHRPPETLSVAWVSRLRDDAAAQTWLPVVATADLRAWMQRESPTPGRFLQYLGLRKTAEDPKRRWKVTVFDVHVSKLCRAIESAEETEVIEGVGACGFGNRTRGDSGCGYAIDRKDGSRGPDLYRIRWADAAARGFCVLPAQRFVEEG